MMGSVQNLTNSAHPSPLELLPSIDQLGLPHYSAEDLRAIAAAGFKRLGVVAAVILQSADTPKLLMLHHKPSEKVAPSGAWGPLAETSHLTQTAAGIEVESIAATIYRSFEEETGMQARFLRPCVPPKSIGAYTTCKWPVGYADMQSFAFGVVPFLYLTNEDASYKLINSFSPTQEIDDSAFMSPGEIRKQGLLRPGTLEWLSVVENSASYNLSGPFVEFPVQPKFSADGQDVIFDNIRL